jgi:hypothetical protein
VWGRLHQAVLDELAERELLDLSRVVLDSAHVRAKKGANLQVAAPQAGASGVPSRMCCPMRQDCPSSSVSQLATPVTATA